VEGEFAKAEPFLITDVVSPQTITMKQHLRRGKFKTVYRDSR